ERLTPTAEQDADFLYVVYEVGGASSREGTHMRHMGREYGLVLSGRLRVTIGFDDEHELGPGDSIAFESSRPHRLENAGAEPVEAIWFVAGRSHGDPRKLALDTSREGAPGPARKVAPPLSSVNAHSALPPGFGRGGGFRACR